MITPVNAADMLWFETQQQGQYVIVTPVASLLQDCRCTLAVEVKNQGPQGTNNTRQQNVVTLIANKPKPLSSMTFSVSPQTQIQVKVTLFDNQKINLEKQWTLPEKQTPEANEQNPA